MLAVHTHQRKGNIESTRSHEHVLLSLSRFANAQRNSSDSNVDGVCVCDAYKRTFGPVNRRYSACIDVSDQFISRRLLIAAHARLESCKRVPNDFEEIILDALDTCTNDTFRRHFETLVYVFRNIC